MVQLCRGLHSMHGEFRGLRKLRQATRDEVVQGLRELGSSLETRLSQVMHMWAEQQSFMREEAGRDPDPDPDPRDISNPNPTLRKDQHRKDGEQERENAQVVALQAEVQGGRLGAAGWVRGSRG